MGPVLFGKTLYTTLHFAGSKVPCNKIAEPGSCATITPKKDHPAFCSPDDPDVTGMTFAATTGQPDTPNLIRRKGLFLELIINSLGKPDRVLFPVFAHIGADRGMDKPGT